MSWYRIERPVPAAQAAAAAAANQQSPPADDFKAYMDRLLKLIPAEIVALYLTFHTAADPKSSFSWWWPIICLVLVIIARYLATRVATDPFWKFQWIAVLVAAVSYLLWIYAIGDSIAGFVIREPIWISAGIAIWTLAVPYFYKGD
jgi:hypothetical protein